MSRILHDTRCVACGTVMLDVVIENHTYPRCEVCGDQTEWVPAKITTDVFGTPQYSDATGQYHSSQRDKERTMRDLGYYPKGDKHHGARVELSIKDTAFSYAGQKTRRSTAERAGARCR